MNNNNNNNNTTASICMTGVLLGKRGGFNIFFLFFNITIARIARYPTLIFLVYLVCSAFREVTAKAMVTIVFILHFGGEEARGESDVRPTSTTGKKVRTGTALHFLLIIENYHNI